MSGAKRREVILSEQDAAKWIQSGMTISIGGFLNSSYPMPLVRAIIRNGVKDLTVVGAASAGLETDLLIGAGCVKTVVAPMISGESLAPIGPSFRHCAQRGELEVIELDEHMYYQGLRAAAALMPSLPSHWPRYINIYRMHGCLQSYLFVEFLSTSARATNPFNNK